MQNHPPGSKKSRKKAISTRDNSRFLESYFGKTASASELLDLFLNDLKEKFAIDDVTLTDLLQKKVRLEDTIPVTIFDNQKLSALEAIVKFLKENEGLSNRAISEKLQRSPRTVWTTYHNAKQKMGGALSASPTKFYIPLSIFAQRTLSVLESLVDYLRTQYSLTYHEIAVLLHRNDRTIWTVANRAKKKKS